ncbi:MAG: pilus assembly protein PilM, partial [Planctomycetales bacterium]|nr:pilus assembly protein PilM [Planctomycetales bacterium]
DAGAGAIKVAQATRSRSRWTLADAAVVERASAINAEPTSRQADADDEILGALSLAERLQGRRAAGVLSMRDCEFHAVHVDPRDASPHKLQQALSAAAPLAWRERTLDHWSIRNSPDVRDPQSPNVGVLSAPITRADRAAADLGRAGLDCRQLDAAPAALARAAGLMVGDSAAPMAVIDWGYSRATFVAVRHGQPLYVRPLRQCEFSQMLRAVGDAAGCSLSQAAVVLQQQRLVGGASHGAALADAVSRLCGEPLQRLQREVRRTLEYLGSHRRHLAPKGIVLLGGGATIAGAAPWLTGALGVETRVWRPDRQVLEVSDGLNVPVALLGEAVAASMLAWGKR